MISYAAMLTKESTPYDLNKNIAPKPLLKKKNHYFLRYQYYKRFPEHYQQQSNKEEKVTRTNMRSYGRSCR